MSDEAQTPEGDAHGPTPPTAPKVGLDKPTEPEGAAGEQTPWAPPASDGTAEPTATADEVQLAPSGDVASASSGHTPASSSGDVSASPFAPIGGGPAVPSGPGKTVTSNDPSSWPPPSVHDQQTVTSMQGPEATPSAQPWANPFAPPTGAANISAGPFAQNGHVPPPPIAPDGPGQVPYGYPSGGYGYPGGAPQAHYGWPGMQPLPSNGMGTAGLVLGILSALVFCLWPLAIILGILGVIFGALGRGKARQGVATNPGQALAGIICGVAGIALGIGMVVLLMVT
jgi:hypothetical protein